MTTPPEPAPELRLRILLGDGVMLGPGKAALLAHIRDTGSISAAGRAMGMSYKRAWSLVESLNAGFVEPLVASARGGPGGGGAHLTATGEAVLAHYHAVLAATASAGARDLEALSALTVPGSDGDVYDGE